MSLSVENFSSGVPARVLFSRLRFLCLGAAALTFLLMLCYQPAKAQAVFGSLVGNITDASGAVVPGATVKITNQATNEVRTPKPSAAGVYTATSLPPGTYTVQVSKSGFKTFSAANIVVDANTVVRVNAQLQIGTQTQTVEVSATAAVLQTDRADVHAEVTSQTLQTLPQPSRTWQSLLVTVPGMKPTSGQNFSGQLVGGTNNPAKAPNFAFNGSGTSDTQVRVEGISVKNPWSTQYVTYEPSNEAIQTVNVVTNASGAAEAFSSGPSVNITLKSGTNSIHGSAYEYNTVNYFQANDFFTNLVGQHTPHLVDNDVGASIGGPFIKNKLFFFGSYEGDFTRTSVSGIQSLPNATMLSGDLSGSAYPIYDPRTGNPDGTGRSAFPGNIIPKDRFDPVVAKLLPHFPAVTLPNLPVNNDYVMDPTLYNLHKIDTKFDYAATQKLRLFGVYAAQPYYNVTQPIYGMFLGGESSLPGAGSGNYLQHGKLTFISGGLTYVASPTLVINAYAGETRTFQLLFPTNSNERQGADLGIPGANVGPLPWAGSLPYFEIDPYEIFGNSYPALQYDDPVFEESASATMIKGSHTLVFGVDLLQIHQNHIETEGGQLNFSGGSTALNGGPSPNEYNAIADFLLGEASSLQNAIEFNYPMTLRVPQYALYVHDQYQVMPKLTLDLGLRWEYYPVPNQGDQLINFYSVDTNTMHACGVGLVPDNCNIHVSKREFAPSIGLAYRLGSSFVIRAGYSVSPQMDMQDRSAVLGYPNSAESQFNGPNSYVAAGTVSGTGIPLIPGPVYTDGITPVPAGTGNIRSVNPGRKFQRGYLQSWNFTIEKEFGAGMLAQVGYVGGHAVNMFTALNINYGQLGGGPESELLYPYGITARATGDLPFNTDKYNSLQATFRKQTRHGLTFNAQFTYSHDIGIDAGANSVILIPAYWDRDNTTTDLDRTFSATVAASYQLPFGKGQSYLQGGVLGAIAGGWILNGVLTHFSGAPFTVTASGASCNCPRNTQTANQVLANVTHPGSGVGLGDNYTPYFNPAAYAPVTDVAFGSSGFNTLRGPGMTNLDLSIYRTLPITERIKVQIRAESFNLTNTPHFATPGSDISSYVSPTDQGGFGQITQTEPLGRLIDSRYFRFGLRITF